MTLDPADYRLYLDTHLPLRYCAEMPEPSLKTFSVQNISNCSPAAPLSE